MKSDDFDKFLTLRGSQFQSGNRLSVVQHLAGKTIYIFQSDRLADIFQQQFLLALEFLLGYGRFRRCLLDRSGFSAVNGWLEKVTA